MNKFIAAACGLFASFGTAWSAAPTKADILFVTGNNVWQPGEQYVNGADWLALNCTAAACSFEEATLAVRAESWQGHYDDEATSGQKLTFKKVSAASGKVIAWIRASAAHPWLAPGPVVTYASNAAPLKRPATDGTLEVAVDLPGNQQATFVPLLDQANKTFLLQLRAPGRRQMLGQLGNCSHQVSTAYFLWAGDLDRDGKPDYLISFVDDDGQVMLYLSSVAAPKELVGVGAVYNAPPFGGECDGGGWVGE